MVTDAVMYKIGFSGAKHLVVYLQRSRGRQIDLHFKNIFQLENFETQIFIPQTDDLVLKQQWRQKEWKTALTLQL